MGVYANLPELSEWTLKAKVVRRGLEGVTTSAENFSRTQLKNWII